MRTGHCSRWLVFAVAALLVQSAAAQLAPSTGLPRVEARAAGFDPAKLTAVDELLKRAVGERQIAGGAALVARRGAIVHVAMAGMQDAEAETPISERTIYRIASMTKPVTSVAAMLLSEEGKLNLDDPVAKFLPEFMDMRVLNPDARAKSPITVRQLLNHTSGITYGFWDKPVIGRLYREAGVADGLVETPGTVLANAGRAAKLPLLFEPGTAWEYGLNTDVLGCVVEAAAGMTLGEFFERRIFGPLAMRDTHFVLPADKRPRLAALYTPDEKKQVVRVGQGPQQIGATRFSATYPLADGSQYQSGGAGLVSTIGDYARFLQCLLNGGELDGRRILKAETVAQMTRNQIGDFAPSITHHGDKFGYGFGVVTKAGGEEIASAGSYSWGGIFYTYFLVDPREELIAIWMSQVYPFDHLALHGEFKQAVYGAISARAATTGRGLEK